MRRLTLLFRAVMKVALTLLGTLLLFAATPVNGAERTARVLVLVSQEGPQYENALEGFRNGLSAHGVAALYDVVRLHGDAAAAKTTLAAPVARAVDVILALGSLAVQAPRPEDLKVPMVAGLVMSAREFENTPEATGVVLEFPPQLELEWLRRFLPDRKNIAVLFNPEENQKRVATAQAASGALGLQLHARSVSLPRDLPAELEEAGRSADVIWGIADHVVMTPQTAKSLLLYSFRNRIPLTGLSTAWVKAGALYALDRDYVDIGVQLAELAQKILGGVNAKSLAPLTPRKVVYAINLKTSRQMKLELSADLVNNAAEVID